MFFQTEGLSDTEHVEHEADREQKAHEDLLKKRQFLLLRLMLSGLLLAFRSQFFRNSLSDHSCPAVNPLENVIDPAEQKEAAGIRRMRQTFSGIFFAAGNKHQKAELNEASNGIKRPQIMKVDLRKIIGSVFNNLLIEPVLNRKDQPSQTETKHINSVAPFSRTVIR